MTAETDTSELSEDPHRVLHIYEGDSAFVVRKGGNKTLYGIELPELMALFSRLPHSPAATMEAVKPLEWTINPHSWKDTWEAETQIGRYSITETIEPAHDNPVEYDIHLTVQLIGTKTDIDAAKAAAQADYEKRIRSALVPAPAGEADRLVEWLNEWLRWEWQSLSHARVELVREPAAAITQLREQARHYPTVAGENMRLREQLATVERERDEARADAATFNREAEQNYRRAEASEAKVLALTILLKRVQGWSGLRSKAAVHLRAEIDAALSPDKGA